MKRNIKSSWPRLTFIHLYIFFMLLHRTTWIVRSASTSWFRLFLLNDNNNSVECVVKASKQQRLSDSMLSRTFQYNRQTNVDYKPDTRLF